MVFTPADQRPKSALGKTEMENLGKDLVGGYVQPFAVTLKPGAGSGECTIVHTGHEFVYCLTGVIHYKVEENDLILKPGDSLVFEAHLPHCWMNDSNEIAQLLLILYPSDEREEFGGRHFSINTMKQEISMKIAVNNRRWKNHQSAFWSRTLLFSFNH